MTANSAKPFQRIVIGAALGLIIASGTLWAVRHYRSLNDSRIRRGEEWNNGDFYFGNDLLCLDLSAAQPAYRFNATVIPRAIANERAGTLFYQRRNAGDGFRLVLVEAMPRGDGGSVDFGATIASGPGKHWSSTSTLDLPRGAKLYHGQPDASDPAHFMIRFESDSQRGVIDAWLTRENAIRFERRDTSAH